MRFPTGDFVGLCHEDTIVVCLFRVSTPCTHVWSPFLQDETAVLTQDSSFCPFLIDFGDFDCCGIHLWNTHC
jgi:hypothetical protein